MKQVDVIGHFGTRGVYGDMSRQLAADLRAIGCLGVVTNLDEKLIDELVASSPVAPVGIAPAASVGRKLLLVTRPEGHFVPLMNRYGEANVAAYVVQHDGGGPLRDDGDEFFGAVGTVFVPSYGTMRWVDETRTKARRLGDVHAYEYRPPPLFERSREAIRRRIFERAEQRLAADCVIICTAGRGFHPDFSPRDFWLPLQGPETRQSAYVSGVAKYYGKLTLVTDRHTHTGLIYEVSDKNDVIAGRAVEVVCVDDEPGSEDLLRLFEQADLFIADLAEEDNPRHAVCAAAAGMPVLTVSNVLSGAGALWGTAVEIPSVSSCSSSWHGRKTFTMGGLKQTLAMAVTPDVRAQLVSQEQQFASAGERLGVDRLASWVEE